MKARQGVCYPVLEGLTVMDPESMAETPRDGETIGEVMMRGNVVMKGYLKNETASDEAFAGGWFHTGDLGVMHEEWLHRVEGPSKDIIISAGRTSHPLSGTGSVPASRGARGRGRRQAGRDMGRDPLRLRRAAFGAEPTETEVIAFCRDNMAHFKVPRRIVFGPLPKTSTGKVQKFNAPRAGARPEPIAGGRSEGRGRRSFIADFPPETLARASKSPLPSTLRGAAYRPGLRGRGDCQVCGGASFAAPRKRGP